MLTHSKTIESPLSPLPGHDDRPPGPARHGAPRAGIGQAFSRMFATLGMLPVLVALYIVFYFLTGYFAEDGISNFATSANTMNVLRQTSINLVLATGMTFVILTGGIDLSVGSVLAVSAVLGMIASLPGNAPALSLPVFLMAGLGLGLLNGVLVAGFRINPFVVTLGTMTALRGAAYLLADGTTILNREIPSFEWRSPATKPLIFSEFGADAQAGYHDAAADPHAHPLITSVRLSTLDSDGHDVTFVTNSFHEPTVRAAGLDYVGAGAVTQATHGSARHLVRRR